MSGIVNRAIELLPSGEAWLSRQSIANPSLDNPTFKTLSDPQDIAFTLLQFTFTHHVAMDREGRKLFDLEASIPANLATYLTEVGPDLVKNYTVRASQIYVQQLVRQHIPAKAGMLSRNYSAEARRIWSEMVADDNASLTSRASMSGRVFVIALASSAIPYAVMWAVESTFSIGRRAIQEAQLQSLKHRLAATSDRSQRRSIEAELSRAGRIMSWETLCETLLSRAGKVVAAVAGTAAGAAVGSFLYPGTGTFVCATIGSILPFVLMAEGAAPEPRGDDPRSASG